MQISSSSAATSSMALQALRDLFQTSSTSKTGQSVPGAVEDTDRKSPPPGPPPGPPPTLSSLLQTQEAEDDTASSLIDPADTNGDGTVSLDELAASLSADAATLSEVFGKVDTDGDGQITSAELDAGLKATHSRHGLPPGGPPAASDVALDILATADGDQDGALSLSEIGSALGQDDTTGIADAFSALDADGDGQLTSEELTAGVTAAFARSRDAYASTATTTASVSLAA